MMFQQTCFVLDKDMFPCGRKTKARRMCSEHYYEWIKKEKAAGTFRPLNAGARRGR